MVFAEVSVTFYLSRLILRKESDEQYQFFFFFADIRSGLRSIIKLIYKLLGIIEQNYMYIKLKHEIQAPSVRF